MKNNFLNDKKSKYVILITMNFYLYQILSCHCWWKLPIIFSDIGENILII